MGQVDWNSVDPRPAGSKGSGKSLFLKFEAGNSYTIRPVGKPHEIIRYFINGNESADGERHFAITGVKGSECVIQQKYLDDDGDPRYPQRLRYAINCFDRSDKDENGLCSLKIVELPLTVARFIRDWGKEVEVNPGSGKGADFKIKVEKTGPTPRDIKYHTFPLNQTPFSDVERAYLEKEGAHDLAEIFKIVPQNEIEEKLGLSGGSSGNTQTASVSNSDDDEFDF